MCGIAGVVSDKPLRTREFVEDMLSVIRHRGPDDIGTEEPLSRHVALGTVRLAVLDLSSAGHQPMWTAERDACITFNGEIYNFRELRCELERSGHRFASESDTEVILAGYREWGGDIYSRLNGMFAFAIWDVRAGCLFMARDRLGKKPLYYWHRNGLFLFASEIKAILENPRVGRRIDPEALQCYLTLGYTPAPRTMFAEVRKLPAAHVAFLPLDASNLTIERRWSPPSPAPCQLPVAELRRQVRTTVEAAVERRLISDVPVGAFLSGGLDSTIVVGSMSRLMNQPVRTFSTAFEVGDRSFKYNADADAAVRVARHFGTDHTEIRVTGEQVVACMRDVVRALDEPITTPMFQTYLLAHEVKRQGVTVVLSGDGSDEVFGGYSRYLRNRMVDLIALLPPPAIRGLHRVADHGNAGDVIARAMQKALIAPLTPDRYLTWWEFIDRQTRSRVVVPDVASRVDAPRELIQTLIDESGISESTDLLAYLDLRLWIAEDSNMRMDKLCMSASVESRAPFLDYHVVELGLSVPFRRKASWTIGKRVLRDAFADVLPADVMGRSKLGWSGPIYHWMRGPLQEHARECIEALPRTGLFTQAVTLFGLQTPSPAPTVVWKLMQFALWYDANVESLGLKKVA